MSTYAIKIFLKELEDIKHYGGTSKETAVRFAFQKLLDEYAPLMTQVSQRINYSKSGARMRRVKRALASCA